jgi:hypothetical protein
MIEIVENVQKKKSQVPKWVTVIRERGSNDLYIQHRKPGLWGE